MNEAENALLERLYARLHFVHVGRIRHALRGCKPPFAIRIDRTTSLMVREEEGQLGCWLLEADKKTRLDDEAAPRSSREDMLPRKRRSIRMSDELWARLSKYGDPSTVAEMLCEEGVARLEARAASRVAALGSETDNTD